MNTGKVHLINEVEGFGDFRKWEITIEDNKGHAVFPRFLKSDNPGFKEGDHISYIINEKGSMNKVTVINPNNPVIPSTPAGNSPGNDSFEPAINKQKQLSIERMSCLDKALVYLADQHTVTKYYPIDVVKLADYFQHWIQTGIQNDLNPLHDGSDDIYDVNDNDPKPIGEKGLPF